MHQHFEIERGELEKIVVWHRNLSKDWSRSVKTERAAARPTSPRTARRWRLRDEIIVTSAGNCWELWWEITGETERVVYLEAPMSLASLLAAALRWARRTGPSSPSAAMPPSA